MRKFIVGIVVGIAVTITSTTYADEVIQSLVGKSIQGEFPVYVNGTKLDNPAIVIDGSSYLPLRKVSEIIHYDIKFDDNKKVINLSNTYSQMTLEKLNTKLDGLNRLIKSRQGTIDIAKLRVEKESLTEQNKSDLLQYISNQESILAITVQLKDDVIAEIASRQ